MRFLLDENAEARIAVFLTERGHNATRIGRDFPSGLSDVSVLSIANRERRIPITNDEDFGELVVREQHPHVGVILLRFPLNGTVQEKVDALAEYLAASPLSLTQFVVLTPQDHRLRKQSTNQETLEGRRGFREVTHVVVSMVS